MDYTYADQKRVEASAPHKENTAQGPSLAALRSGAAIPTPEQRGRRVDLPDAMRAKMEAAFGADLSAVKLYESQTVADAGAKAVARGSDIAFAPGMLDFTSFGGQSLLGHEISHVVSQARGEVTGGGYLNDYSLEARADREGAMAAAGQQISVPTASLSPVSAAPAAGPMQAARSKKADQAPAPAAGGFGFDQALPAAQLPDASAIKRSLGRGHSLSRSHGKQYREMMSSLTTLSDLRKGRGDMGGIAREAMVGNANQKAIAQMQQYRDKLVAEGADKRGRQQQIDQLNAFIQSAQADQQTAQAQQNLTLSGQEFSGTMSEGALNQVYRYERDQQGAYFKPEVLRSPTGDNRPRIDERQTMKDSGIIPENYDDADRLLPDVSLSKREVAFSRLGSLLGSSVTLGAKQATLGADTPTNQVIGGKTFKSPAGTAGVLQEEAKGKSWSKFGWQFPALAPPAEPAAQAEGSISPAATILSVSTDMGKTGEAGTTVGERLEEQGYSLTTGSTDSPDFDEYRHPTKPGKTADFPTEDSEKLDMADPDFQRQMNEMFLLDTLAAYRDRHEGNYLVNRDEHGKVGVKAIDNDLSFGTFGAARDSTLFGKNDRSTGYGGLPAQMQIDAAMAERIQKIDRATLDLAFQDVLKPEEIDALENRFGMMREYIDAMKDAGLLVKKWDAKTAQREMRLASGDDSAKHEDRRHAGGFLGNNYFQRQAIKLNAYRDPVLRDKHMML